MYGETEDGFPTPSPNKTVLTAKRLPWNVLKQQILKDSIVKF